jgi:hypothetical protein
LKDHGHIARARRQLVDHLLADADRAAGDALESRQHAQARRLAAPGWSEQDEKLAARDVQGELVHGHHPAEGLADLLERHRCAGRFDRSRHPVTPPSVKPRMM